MRIKSYFAQSVQEAMQRARLELGPEALLLSSKKTIETGASAAYEVVFGLSGESELKPVESLSVVEKNVSQQLAELRQQIENMQKSITARSQPANTQESASNRGFAERLLTAGFSPAMADDLLQFCHGKLAQDGPSTQGAQPGPRRRGRPPGSGKRQKIVGLTSATEHACEVLLDEVEARFSVAPELGLSEREQRLVVFVGPPGAGKTTTLVKLAVAYGTLRKTSVQILSIDTLRLGGAEQLHAYSRILGARFQAVTGCRTLQQAIEEVRLQKIILIDTPGFGPADMDEAAELASFVQHHPNVEVQLVLPATLQAQAMCSALQRFRRFNPSKLLFTHLDEIDSPAGLIEAAIRSGLPISFLANGQQIPENLAEASKVELRAMLATRLKDSASAAA